jgi:RHS repeat-associated protein
VATHISATRCSPPPVLLMPRLSPLWPWSRVILTRAVGLTLVLLALLAPRLVLAATPRSSGAMPVSLGRGSSATARVDADASSPTTRRMLNAAATLPSKVDARRDSANSASRFIFVNITHAGNGSASVYTNASGSTSFTVTNTGSAGTVLYTVTDCTGNITNCSPSPAAGYLSAGSSMPVSVLFAAGMTPGSGWFTLKAWDQSNNSFMASYTVNVTVTADPNAPTVSLAPHLGDRRDVSQCVADCFESTLSYTLPAYISLDVPRSATMLYRSGSAYPHGKLSMDVTAANAPAGSTFRLRLRDSAGTYVMFPNQTTSLFFARNTTGATRLVAEFDATQIPTSARLYTAEVSTVKADGSTFGTSLATVRIIILNDRNSPFGAGVRVVGIQRMSTTTGGVLVTDGSGSAAFFAGNCSNVNVACAFTSPAGEFSTLSTASGFYKRTYPDGSSVWFYPGGHHRSSVERFGSATYIDYGWLAQYGDYVPTAITDPTGQSITFWYRDPGSLYGTWKDGSLGNIHTPMGDAPIGIDANNDAREWVELGGGTYRWRMKYLTQHLLDTTFDKASSAWKHSYRYGATMAYTDAPSIELANGSTTRPRVSIRDAWAQLLDSAAAGKGTIPANALAVPTNSRASVTDALGNTTTFSLSKFGSPTKTKLPLIPADSNEYDANTGQLLRSISSTGHEVLYTYDAQHRLQIVHDVTLWKADTIAYAPQYWLPLAIFGSSGQQWFTYHTDKSGWPLKTTSPLQGEYVTLHHPDSFGRDTLIEDWAGHRTMYSYANSGLRNRVSMTGPNQRTTTVGRNGWGMVHSGTAPDGAAWTSALDILNRPGWIAGQYGDTTRFLYAASGADSAVVDAKNQTYAVVQNALGWVTRRTHPVSGFESIGYDASGRVVSTRSRQGREVLFEYDSLGRVTKQTGVGTQSVIHFWYDSLEKWVAVQSKVGSTVISTDTVFTDEPNHQVNATTTRWYGAWRVLSTFNSNDPGRSSVYLYKRVNNADVTVSRTIYRYWDAQKRLTSMESLSDTANIYYNGESLVDSVALRAGLTEKFTYTSSHSPSARGYTGASWVDDVLRRSYHRDSLDRIGERGGPDSLFQTFSYDSVGRLRWWKKKTRRSGTTCINTGGSGYTCSGTPPSGLDSAFFAYDKVGNPTDLGAVTTNGNRLTTFNGVTMTYDDDGYMRTRVTSTTTDSLTWDEFGQLISVMRVGQSQPTTFAYDGFGRRIRKTSASVGVREYLWDGDKIIAELDGGGSGNVVQTYTYYPGDADHPRSVTSGDQTYFFSTEPDGTVDGLIRKSDREVVAKYTYTPWGQLESESQQIDPAVNRLRWKGLPYDPETGLYYMRARYYDPMARRFISEDPIGLEGGINQYTFGAGDPINRSDPSGLDWICYPRWVEDGYWFYRDDPSQRYEFGHWERACYYVRPDHFDAAISDWLHGQPTTREIYSVAKGIESAGLGGVEYLIPFLRAGSLASREAGPALARRLGRAGEKAAGIVRNSKRIPSATGTALYRVPDGLTKSTLGEVKNVRNLGLTNQIRDYAAYAEANNLTFELYIRRGNGTVLSVPLQKFVTDHNIVLRRKL